MTREQILSLAKQYSQYPDTKEMTLRGESIVEFAEALLDMAENELAEQGMRFRLD